MWRERNSIQGQLPSKLRSMPVHYTRNRGSGRCHLVEIGAKVTTLLKQFAMKYYPDEQMVDEEIARAGKAAQVFEIEIEYLSGKEIQER